jgi:hypothetical protein
VPLILGALVGAAAGLGAGGSLRRLGTIRLRWPLVVIAALAVREAGVLTPLSRSPLAAPIYTTAIVALLAWIVWHARLLPGMWLLAAGVGLNLVVVIANGGHMPVDPAFLNRGPAALAANHTLGQYAVAGPDTRLAWLGDRLAAPAPLNAILPSAYSIGDVVAGLGMAATLYLAVGPRRPGARKVVLDSHGS